MSAFLSVAVTVDTALSIGITDDDASNDDDDAANDDDRYQRTAWRWRLWIQ